MRTRLLTGALLAALVAVPLAASDGKKETSRPGIEGLQGRIEDGRVLASFRVVNGLGEETLERIHSGIPVAFRHRLDLLRRRALPLLPAKEIARTKVTTQVAYDSLTGQYSLLRSFEIKGWRKRDAPPPPEQRDSTRSIDEMRSWMTELREIPVFHPQRSLPEANLRLRVESNLGRRFVLWIFPATLGASAELRLER